MKYKRDIVTALVVCSAVLCFSFCKNWLNQGAALRSTYPLTLILHDARGLDRGAEVQIAGVKVGQVEAVTLDSNLRQALVEVRLSRDIQIPSDSLAFVEPPALKIRVGRAYGTLAPGEKLLSIEERIQRKLNE
jgi:ABC-type transporter Mla subunit MlaD